MVTSALVGDTVSTLIGRHGVVTALRVRDGFTVVAGPVNDPETHTALRVSGSTLAVFADDVLAHLDNRPTTRVVVPFEQPFPVSVRLVCDDGVLNLLDDGDDLALLTPSPAKHGTSRLTPGDVETFARELAAAARP